MHAVKEHTLSKYLPVRNRTVYKMSWCERLFHMILEIGQAIALMTSRQLQNKRGKNLKRHMHMIELRTRWAMENVFLFASSYSLISIVYNVTAYTDILRKSGELKIFDWWIWTNYYHEILIILSCMNWCWMTCFFYSIHRDPHPHTKT